MSVLRNLLLLAAALLLSQCQAGKTTTKPLFPAFSEHYDDVKTSSAMFGVADMKFAFRGKTKSDFEKWQNAFRPELKKTLGLAILETQLAGFKPRAERISSEDIGFAIREKWRIWTEPTVPLPFILLRPKGPERQRGLVIAPHGHSKNTEMYAGIYYNDHDKEHAEAGERDVAIQAVKEGYIAIAPTARGFGETRTATDLKADADRSCRTLLLHNILVGRTAVGDRVWDVSKIIDWALAELHIDPKKIVVTGNSGGGTTTLFAAACDTRIAAGIPASYFNTFSGSIGTFRHCECNYIPGILNLGEMGDIAGLIAPRLFCAINGKLDKNFPIIEARKSFQRAKDIYQVAGAPGNCEFYEGAEGHRYYKAGAWPFLNRHWGGAF
ncbi:hypothetical protein DYBT9275_04383 [Dyadobacter sp. CECT 9275]|uniref:Acetyl xylan esterase domain-containing protein n=1 Tax=Dyadobacter helix TaxID=2822344 RepID=A0A916JFA5_9BACT|nr:alpha/beta hydrolase family protein [Dyadobacter sp. CECT 9275]CAG5008909.1 hypothetical protein DYBT9275_04383 [Dyadobacter sp. CECT 9275]